MEAENDRYRPGPKKEVFPFSLKAPSLASCWHPGQ